MWLIDALAEARIAEAVARGEFENLPGRGKALELEDDVLIPEDLRVAYRILKNAGYVPRELELRREIHAVEELLACTANSEERTQAMKRFNYLLSQLALARGTSWETSVEQAYFERLAARFNEPR